MEKNRIVLTAAVDVVYAEYIDFVIVFV